VVHNEQWSGSESPIRVHLGNPDGGLGVVVRSMYDIQ